MQQEYRVCGNFPKVNARIELPAHPMLKCEAALDGTKEFIVKSSLDIKAEFNNIPIPHDLQRYMGLVTQDLVFVYQRMPFGANAAPAHFQFVMNQALK